jgi:hypothetical protein
MVGRRTARPDLPPHLRGRSYVVVEAACQNSPDEVDAPLGPVSDATASASPPATRPRRWPPDARYAHKTDGYTATASAARGPSSCSGRCPSDLPGGVGRPRGGDQPVRRDAAGDPPSRPTSSAPSPSPHLPAEVAAAFEVVEAETVSGFAGEQVEPDRGVTQTSRRMSAGTSMADRRAVRLIALCSPCHLVAQFGYANVQGRTDEDLPHLRKVNGLTLAEALAHASPPTSGSRRAVLSGRSIGPLPPSVLSLGSRIGRGAAPSPARGALATAVGSSAAAEPAGSCTARAMVATDPAGTRGRAVASNVARNSSCWVQHRQRVHGPERCSRR